MHSVPAIHNPHGLATEDVVLPQQFLTLSLGEELYALPINDIREIMEFTALTEIPLMPEYLRGVINLRGAVVPVIDLSVRFARGRTAICKRTCIVIIEVRPPEGGSQLLGILVDAVNEVLAVEGHQLQARPALGARIRAEFIAGIIKQAEQFIVILNIAQALALDEIEELVSDLA